MATVPIKPHRAVSAMDPLTTRVVDAVSEIEGALLEVSQPPASGASFLPLSVVIPVFNERNTIQQVIERVASLRIDKQIIVVDDGSTDGTREILASYVGRPGIEIVLHSCNQGKGAALRSGFEQAQGEVVIVQDADLEYDPQDILTVIQPVLAGQCDVCYGSRYLDSIHQDPSALHRFGNWLLTQFSNWMTSHRLTDMETCYKAVRRSVLKSITIEQRRFGFEPEITAKLARGGHRIVEVPVSYKSRSWSEGKKIGVRDLINTLWCIVRYRFG
ncbi:MAG: glycosyltransferase family 2 protein [Pirellula sp.]|nr:glycosyltransferase family 2 protein [Pirellula sp.]